METNRLPHVLELRCEPIPLVRIGLIGLGQRGMKTLQRYANIEGAEICCIADLDDEKLDRANETLLRSGRPVARCFRGPEGWREICREAEVDLVYVCTEWSTHTLMATEAMRCGKHVAVEVPAAMTVEECRALVETAEQTRRHCFMTENCCYDRFSLSTLEMERCGKFGEITHCEGAYIHDLRDTFGLTPKQAEDQRLWMERSCAAHGGNPYPTHGIGPFGWLLNLHRGDRMDNLVSLTSVGKGRDGIFGKVNNTLIRTVKGISILLQFDVTTPRPYSRLQTVCGSKGFSQKYPVPTLCTTDTESTLVGEAALEEAAKYDTGAAIRLWEQGHALGVPNEMNYAMDARLIHCLRHGLPLDIDVYDAAEWSCLTELSALSAREGSRPVAIPDFTNGRWTELKSHHFYV